MNQSSASTKPILCDTVPKTSRKVGIVKKYLATFISLMEHMNAQHFCNNSAHMVWGKESLHYIFRTSTNNHRMNFYRQPTKLREGNVFSSVCHSVCLTTGHHYPWCHSSDTGDMGPLPPPVLALPPSPDHTALPHPPTPDAINDLAPPPYRTVSKQASPSCF